MSDSDSTVSTTTITSGGSERTTSVAAADSFTDDYETWSPTTAAGKTFIIPYFETGGVQTFAYEHLTTVTPTPYVSSTSSSGAIYYYSVSTPDFTSTSSYEVVYSIFDDIDVQSIIETKGSSISRTPDVSAFSTSTIPSSSANPSTTLATSTRPTATPGSAQTSDTHHSHAGAIAGGVVGGLAGLAMVAGVVVLYLRRQKKAQREGVIQEVSQID